MATDTVTQIEGFGTQFGYCATLTGTYTFLGELVDHEPSAQDVGKIKTTHSKSTGKVHTYRPGLKEPGEAKVTIHMDKTEYGALLALKGVSNFWQTLYADGSTTAQAGFVSHVGPKVDIEGINTVELTIQMSGPETYTPAP